MLASDGQGIMPTATTQPIRELTRPGEAPGREHARARDKATGLCSAWGVTAIFLGFVLVVAAVMRSYGLDKEGFWGDEYAQTQLYPLPLHYTCWYALIKHGFGPPDFIIGWLMWRISPAEWMCRLPSVLWGIAATGLLFVLGRRLWDARAGLIAAGLLALSPMHIMLSRDARPYSICIAFVLLTLILALRVFEQPSRGRVIAFFLCAWVCTMTRTLVPLVILLGLGLTLTAVIVARKRGRTTNRNIAADDNASANVALRRLWWATLLAGLAALPPLVYLIAISPHTSFANSFVPNIYEIDTRLHAKLADFGAVAGGVLLDQWGPIVLAIAALGAIVTVRRWRELTIARKCMIAVFLLACPIHLLAFSLTGGVHGFYERYNFYLMPIVALLAAGGAVWLLDHIRADRRRIAATIATLALLIWPGTLAIGAMNDFRVRDWRGCADHLTDRIAPDDVVMVLGDVPFGRVQDRFFGKYEWPVSRRPLGEAMWTLAVSDNHFDRLRKQSGSVYVVVARPVESQERDEYLETGLRAAPPGYTLTKFRGLDLLVPKSRSKGDAQTTIEQICRDALTWPLENDSVRVIPMTLLSALSLHEGDAAQGMHWYAEAETLVPPAQKETFKHATRDWKNRRTPASR